MQRFSNNFEILLFWRENSSVKQYCLDIPFENWILTLIFEDFLAVSSSRGILARFEVLFTEIAEMLSSDQDSHSGQLLN